MDKLSLASRAIIFLWACLLLGFVGHQSQDNQSFQEFAAGKWRVPHPRGGTIEISCLVFPASPETVIKWETRRQLNSELIEYARNGAQSAPTEELRLSHEKDLRRYTEDLFGYAGSWEGSSNVLVNLIMTREGGNRLTIVVCRSDKHEADVAFLVTSSMDLTHKEVLDRVRRIAEKLNKLSAEEFRKLPSENCPVYGDDGAYESVTLREFAKEAVFPEQH